MEEPGGPQSWDHEESDMTEHGHAHLISTVSILSLHFVLIIELT